MKLKGDIVIELTDENTGDPEEYLETIRADGYATDSKYVEKNMKLIRQYNLTDYDEEEREMAKTAAALVAQAKVATKRWLNLTWNRRR